MKYLKIFAVAAVALFGFNTAKAQVSISAQIGTPAPAPVVYEEPVYVARPVYRRPPRRVVVVNRYHRRYHRPVLVSRRAYYHRPAHRPVLMRRH